MSDVSTLLMSVVSHQYVLILLGLIGLFAGGELFVKGASTLGRRLGLSDLFVGLAIVGFGTSAAELAVSIDAALQGSTDIALANVVGSNIANVALVLGVTALIKTIQVDAVSLKRDIPFMLFASAALLLLLADGHLSRYEGLGLLGGLFIYLFIAWRQSADNHMEPTHDAASSSLAVTLGSIFGGIVLLVAGSHWLVAGAITVSLQFGVTQAVIGATVVAIGTSLPEITVSVVAALRGRTDMALGNIVGSNIWNILAVLGTASLIIELPRGNVGWDMLGLLMVSALTLTLMAKTGLRITRIEAMIMLLLYALCQAWVVYSGTQ